MRGGTNPVCYRPLRVLLAAQMADDVLHHHHRAIHHQAKIQRAERQQIRGNAPQVKKDRCKQQRERNRKGDDQCAAGIAQEQEEHHRHQQEALGEIAQHRPRGVVDQVAPVQKGHDLDPRRQNVIVNLPDFLVNRSQCRFGVRSLAQEQAALHHVVMIGDLAALARNRLAHPSQTNLRALLHRRDIADPHRRSILRLDHCPADVIYIPHLTDHPHVDLLQADLDEAAAGVGVVPGQLLFHLA